MKKHRFSIKKGLQMALLGLFVTGCNPDFLEQQKLGEENLDLYFINQDKAVASLVAAYSDVKDYRFGWGYWAFGETLSDNTVYGGNDGDVLWFEPLKVFNGLPSHSLITNKWRVSYRGANRTSQTIEGIQRMDNALFESVAFKNRLIAEAKVLRAFYHFELVRSFGRIPILDRVIKSSSEKIGQSEITDVYAFIIKELEEAEPYLPKKSNYSQADLGRITQGYAQGLLAKVNLYIGNYAKAREWAKKVMDSNEYQLLPNYAELFTFAQENGVESLFEVNFHNSQTESAATNNNGNFQTLFMLPRDITYGYGMNAPTQNLADAFDAAGDVIRKNATLLTTDEVYEREIPAEVLNSGDNVAIQKWKNRLTFNRTGYFQEKMYVYPANRSAQIRNNANNIRIMRYAEVLLIYAEASAEVGEETDARSALNQVRTRVGLPDVTAGGTALKDAIFNERRLELAGECERYHDLIRTGRANATILPGWTEVRKYWPVPQTEIDNTTGEITQNTGYN